MQLGLLLKILNIVQEKTVIITDKYLLYVVMVHMIRSLSGSKGSKTFASRLLHFHII